MKIKYYGYYLKTKEPIENTYFDMRSFLENFAEIDNATYKSGFSSEGENLYLFKTPEKDVFLFIETRNTEFFKKIDKKNLTFSDLSSMISGQNELGYASYVIVKENCIGFCSTYMAPSASTFSKFINDIILSLGIIGLDFKVEPLLQDIKPSEVMSMKVVGRTTLSISRSNDLTNHLLNVFGADLTNDISLDSIEITFKPKIGKSIKEITKRVLHSVEGSEDALLRIRAKQFTSDILSDFYLGENGHAYDEIKYDKEDDIPKLMFSAFSSNQQLDKLLKGLFNNVNITGKNNSTINNFCDILAWSNMLANISKDFKKPIGLISVSGKAK